MRARRAGRACWRDLKRRGLKAPMLAVGDGALGFWRALRDVWPETREQRCWVHRLKNVLDKLPKRLQGEGEAGLARDHVRRLQRRRRDRDQSASARTTAPSTRRPSSSLLRDRDCLLTFFDFPAEHWQHLRTTNAIESTFATVRLRQKLTKGAGSRNKALLMAYKLLDMAQKRWRRVNAPHLVALVRDGVAFDDGNSGQERCLINSLIHNIWQYLDVRVIGGSDNKAVRTVLLDHLQKTVQHTADLADVVGEAPL